LRLAPTLHSIHVHKFTGFVHCGYLPSHDFLIRVFEEMKVDRETDVSLAPFNQIGVESLPLGRVFELVSYERGVPALHGFRRHDERIEISEDNGLRTE